MTVQWISRVTDALVLWLTLSVGAASSVLAAGGTVPDWLLLACGVAALPLARRLLPETTLERREFWTLLSVSAVVLATFAVLGFGADQTPSRHWDGAVAWDVKNALLADDLTLDQAVFRDPAILHHSRDYPLGQPLLVAMVDRWTGAGRLVLPLAWLLACLAIFVCACRRGVSVGVASVTALAFGLTPALVSTNSGGVDSGYADFTLAAWATVAAAGCVGRDRRWIALGVMMMAWTKPEGLPYGAALLLAAWVCSDRAALSAASLGWAAGAAVLLPLQHELVWADRQPLPASVFALALAPAVVAAGSDLALRRFRGAWHRLGLALLLGAGLLLCLPTLAEWSGNERGSLARYLRDIGLLWDRLPITPEVAGAMLEHGVFRGRFGLLGVLLLLAFVPNWRRRVGTEVLSVWLVWLLPIWIATFAISNIELQDHLRSRMPRLLIHAAGIAWAFLASALPLRASAEKTTSTG
ncbi:MAG: hypothetical protein VX044_10285 [Planctomycetota bacterium]|nr:hypothetical protein [Planctomycetota bacterium]